MYRVLKRFLDISVALIAIILFGWLMVIIAILIYLDDPKGTIFADIPKRVGYKGELFRIYKFRSMVPNAHNLIKEDKTLAKLHKIQQGKLTIDQDPRITKIGKFIRKVDLDEFPQFINVLLGNMSVVGPRAYYRDELDGYLKDFPEITDKIDTVLSVKPGITGPWQVSGRNHLTIPERVMIDYKYAKRKSVLYDLYIILKTPIAVITRFGALE